LKVLGVPSATSRKPPDSNARVTASKPREEQAARRRDVAGIIGGAAAAARGQ
jgi:hypothetical protein